MAARTFSTTVEFKAMIEPIIAIAVQNSCNILLGTLQQLIISRYYDLLDPEYYRRSFQFYESAITKMLNNLTGEIFMDANAMDYGKYWDGETQLYMANSGYHGSVDIHTDGEYWNEFIEYCEANAVNILKQELKKQGLQIT